MSIRSRFMYLFFIAIIALVMVSCNKKENNEGDETIKLPDTVTFSEHIAPIIYENCTPCHRDNAAGPFNLTNYDEVKSKAKTIVKVTQSRFMPPWPADPEYASFKEERRLNNTQIAMLKKWYDDDCPVGDLDKLPPVPSYPKGSQIGKPDLVLKFPEIHLEGNNIDHFFLVKIPFELPEDKYVRLIEFIPGEKKLAHHMNANLIEYQPGKKVNVFGGQKIIPTNLAESAESVQTAMDNKNDDGSYPLLVPLVCNYLPGVSPAKYPEGIGGFKMTKQGAFFINDFHFGPSAKDAIDSTSIFNIFFADKPPVRPTFEILMGSLGVAPVKPALIIPANEIKTFTIDYEVQEAMSVLTVNPHMHLLGQSFIAYAITPRHDTIPMIHIPKWDFRWQFFYTYKKVLVIPAGSRIHVEGTFDNTEKNVNNPYFPPQVIIDRGDRFDSMKTTNEMLQFIITFMPYQAGDETMSLE